MINISVDGFLPLNIQKNTDLVPSQAKFNAWKMISPTCKNDTPGNIYEDKNKVFEFFNLAKDYSDGKKYGEAAQRLKEDGRIMYIGVSFLHVGEIIFHALNFACEGTKSVFF